MAVVLRVAPPDRSGISAFAIWERCGAIACPWAPPPENGRLARQDHGAWVVSLTRPAFERDQALEFTAPLPDGSHVRFGFAAANDDRAAAARPDLPTCIRDLGATLAAAARDEDSAVLDEEIELVCRIWVHPEQVRNGMRWHPALHEIARAHACDMAERAYFGHTDPDGVGPNRRARDAGYPLPDWYDAEEDGNNIESLAMRGPVSSPSLTLEQWLESPLHRQHVLGETEFKAAQDDTATGYCRTAGDGIDKHYWAFVSAQSAP